MSEANDYLNRRTLENAVKLHREFCTDVLDEFDGGVLLHSLVSIALGSILAQPERDEGVTATTASPELQRDAWELLAACRLIVRGSDGDCIAALLQATLHAMRPMLLEAVAERLEAAKLPS